VKPWRVILNGVDITQKVDLVETRFEAENVSGEIEVSIADRAVLDGIVLPRVPQGLSIVADALVAGAWVNRGSFFLEEVTQPPDLRARTAAIWGRTQGARLTKPFAPKISRQWPAATTIAAILEELGAMCGVAIQVQNDFPICAYCYAVSDWYPSQIIQDLAEKSGQICWPQVDGSLLLAPRLYRNLPDPDVTLIANQIEVKSVKRQVPDFGNRILVSGDGAVAGLSVQVVPMYPEDECVAANGIDQVRLIAVVLGVDGDFVVAGTTVNWSAGAGFLADQSSDTGYAEIIGEEQRADDYYHVTLDLPAAAVIGVYAYSDIRRKRNLYQTRRGNVSGRVITFLSPLDFFDQALLIDYEVLGAINTWTAGRVPGDIVILASVAGAQGQCTVHQSNPTACASTLTLESVPSQVCLGERATITAKATMFGGAGSGKIRFALSGCGALSSSQKILTTNAITERVRTTNWGGVTQIRVSAVPASGAINVYLESASGTNLYASHDGQTINLSSVLLSGTEVVVSYPGGGTTAISWIPTAGAGDTVVREAIPCADDGQGGSIVTLSFEPTDILIITQSATYSVPPDLTGTIAGNVVTLISTLPAGTILYCTYWAPQPLLPDCEATIVARIDDGSQDGGIASIKVSARDCRDQTTDPALPPEEASPDDPVSMPDLDDDEEEEEEETGLGCDAVSIQGRTPAITADNWDAVSGVGSGEDCPGLCSCDEICAALRSNGTLATAGEFYSTCVAKCVEARNQRCTPCTLTGPSILNPGQEGTWNDGKGNSAEVSGGNALTFVSRDFATGYTLRMPTGGQGPFTIKVCYGETEDTCCEAEVDFPPCSLSGVTTLEPGVESLYLPSAGMTGATCTCGGDMEFVRLGAYGTGFVCRMKDGGCEGSVTVAYGGRVCGVITVTNPLKDYVGAVSGPSALEAGETAIYYHDLGPGATYTGNIAGTPFENELGNGVVCTAQPGADDIYEVSFSGVCGSSASKSVTVRDISADCTSGVNIGEGAFPGPGAYVNHPEHFMTTKIGGLLNPNDSTSVSVTGTWGTIVLGHDGPVYFYHVFEPYHRALYGHEIACHPDFCGGICP
jgi:hypothetical protein